MKTKKHSAAKRGRAAAVPRKAARRRPVHKRVLLHPFSAFVLLCVGVLVTGSTFPSLAVSYDVTATVPTTLLTSPAVITSPTDGQHVEASELTVQGTCPDASYVKLYRESEFAGSALCEGGQYSVQTTLHLGGNELQARVFNFTDNEGPQSPAITVFYDLAVQVRPPASPPTMLTVANLDEEGYESGETMAVGAFPTVSGYAPPFSKIVVTFYSEPSVCQTTADVRGVWRCTLAHALPPGIHEVVIVATTPAGKTFTLPTFEIRVVEYAQGFAITADYRYKTHSRGQAIEWPLGITGGTAPYQLLVDWGDGSTSRLDRPDRAGFTTAHAYSSSSTEGAYIVLVTAMDNRGAVAVLQLTAAMQPVASAGDEDNLLAGITATIQRWLWVVWPVYIGVVLMVLSFWIGEREAYQRFMARRRLGRPRPHAGRR